MYSIIPSYTWLNNNFREIAEAIDIDAEGSRPEQSTPVNMPSALRHGSVPVRLTFHCHLNSPFYH